MKDSLGRTINYLRVSVTDRCNLRCRYCMPEEGVEWLPHEDILSYEDILRLAAIFARLGWRRSASPGENLWPGRGWQPWWPGRGPSTVFGR